MFTLKLKIRKGDNRVTMSHDQLVEVMAHPDEKGAQKALWAFMKKVLVTDIYVLDKNWLLNIVNWQPKGGQATNVTALWFNLIMIVNEIDEKIEGTLEINQFQAGLIQERLKLDEFIAGTEPQWIGFLLDFKKATGFG